MKETPNERYRLGTVDRAVAVLEAFDGSRSLRQAEIARSAGLSEATTLRYLTSLAGHSLVERDQHTGEYRLGLRLFELAARALGDGDPRHAALPVMKELLERFGETVNFGVRDGDALILIEALEGTRSIRRGAMVGGRDAWHASALGKAILAYLPEEAAESMLVRCGCPRLTRRTLTNPEAVMRELADVRVTGYSFDNGEAEEDLRCVAAPIFDRRGTPSYAISLSGPANRLALGVMKQMGDELRQAAATVSSRLGYSPWRG